MKPFTPYVTAKGGVVILNGPFDLKDAHEIAQLCRAAPDMLKALTGVVREFDLRLGPHGYGALDISDDEWKAIDLCRSAIARAVLPAGPLPDASFATYVEDKISGGLELAGPLPDAPERTQGG